MQYCFIFGCQRSGTTALVRLIRSHPEIVMGTERYKYLRAADWEAAGPALFEPERFADLRPTDTNLRSEERLTYCREAAGRIADGSVRYAGDKLKAQPVLLRTVERTMPAPKYFFIYRDLLHVANSFEIRARRPDDRWQKHYSEAPVFWQRAVRAADVLDELAGPERVFVVRYERLFNGDESVCDAVFRFLGLPTTPEVRSAFAYLTANWEARSTKPLVLAPGEIEEIERQRDVEALERLDERFEAQLS
ncbi:MAG: sulfotransferase [Acidimicrobiales bacterium]|nr:sulfotransferase [Acidimicrobiales bacterium]